LLIGFGQQRLAQAGVWLKIPLIAHASAIAANTDATVSDSGGIIAGAYFLFEPLR
jgi:hypothetical protein